MKKHRIFNSKVHFSSTYLLSMIWALKDIELINEQKERIEGIEQIEYE